MSGTNAVQCPACGAGVPEGSAFCRQCGQGVSWGADQTLYTGTTAADPAGPLVVGGPPPPASGAGLKIAVGVVATFVVIAGAALVTVILRGGSTAPPTTVAAAPSAASTSVTTETSTTTTTATTVITIAAASPPTSDARLLGNDLAAHASEIAAIDQFYRAIVDADWDYTRSHFINAEGRGPNESAAWWQSQYGTIDEYWLAPVRATDGVLWVGLVTHETGAEGRFSYQFCIPFTVSAEGFVRQTDQAVPRFTLKTDGLWIDPEPAAAALLSC